ncbi:MAG TPA: pilus assembly protein TadG-related protein [Candidatus Limnocylindrales bacterium]
MSSTTERLRALLGRRRPGRRGQPASRGQVLVVFAFGIVGILAVAALVFDVGQNLFERRKQQDAADASALAGARWLTTTSCRTAASVATCPEAYNAAMALANTHGYPASQVTINIPPTSGPFSGHPGHIQVAISSTRGSYFAAVVGITSFRIGASAVAENNANYPFPYSLLSLNQSGCKAGWAHGNGLLTVEGDLMVNSSCSGPNGALTVNGTGAEVAVSGNCAAVGTIVAATGTLDCGTTTLPAPIVADPLAGLAPPTIGSATVPNPPASMVVTGADLASNTPPNGCPGSASPSTASTPTGCTVSFNRDKVVWIYPGVYYGGLAIKQTSASLEVYLAPGIYYMAGGGFEITGQPVVRTVEPATGLNPFPTVYGGGVLIYNSQTAISPIKPINLTNTVSVQMHGIDTGPYDGMLFWQDRNASSQPAMAIQGSTTMTLSGTIYLPKADFIFTGNGGSEVLDAQVICDEFEMGGNGDVTITYDPDDAILLNGIGLVE